MARWFFSLLAVLTITSGAQASLHQFICNEQFSPNKITVLGSGVFEVADTPTDGFKYLAVQPLQITVDAQQGTVGFDLLRASTLDNRIHMIFGSQGGYRLYMRFDVAGIVKGDPLPASWGDDDGVVEWNTNNQVLDPNGKFLNGKKSAVVAAVPEPSAFGFGCSRSLWLAADNLCDVVGSPRRNSLAPGPQKLPREHLTPP